MSHVILYVHDLRSSGVVRNALLYASRIGQDHPTTLVAGYGEGLFADEARRSTRFSVRILAPAPGRMLPRLAAVRRLRWLLLEKPGSVLLSVGNHGHATAFLASRGMSHIQRIYRISNQVERDDGVRGAWRQAWMKLLVRDASRIVLVGAALARVPTFARALDEGKAVAIRNGIDLESARGLAAAPAPHPCLEDAAVPVVLGIGRLRPQKNLDLLIEGVARARRAQRIRLIILGGGSASERDRLSALAAANGLGDDFLLAGETDNVFAWLSRAALFVLPSRWEGSSMALIEALAVGTPVVASRLAGDAATVLADGLYGRLFDGVDPEALADAILSQLGGKAVLPGARGQAYGSSADAYAKLVNDVIAGTDIEAPGCAAAFG